MIQQSTRTPRVFQLLLLMAVLVAACSSTAGTTTTTSPYAHPRTYAWSRAHANDLQAVISEAQLAGSSMQCHSGAVCQPSSPPSLDPADWPAFLTQQCAALTTDVSNVRSDKPIPRGQERGWWVQSLSDFDQACAWIAKAFAAEQRIQSDPSAHRTATDAGAAAASALQGAVQEFNLVISYATAR